MTNPLAQKVLHGALVTVDANGRALHTLAFDYNPSSLRRSLTSNTVGGDEGNRSQTVRFVGAPVETVTFEAFFDATDGASPLGVYPELAALELLTYPPLDAVQQTRQQLAQGTLEVVPLEAPSMLFVWGPQRVVPARVVSYEVSEQLFAPNLTPIRATVVVTLRLLTYSDVEPGNRDYQLFEVYQAGLERMAQQGYSTQAQQALGVNLGGA